MCSIRPAMPWAVGSVMCIGHRDQCGHRASLVADLLEDLECLLASCFGSANNVGPMARISNLDVPPARRLGPSVVSAPPRR